MQKHTSILLVLLLAMWAVAVIAALTEEGNAGVQTKHPHYPTMDRGAADLQDGGSLLALAWVLGLLQIATFVAFLALGARRREGLGPMSALFVLGGLLYGGVFTLMLLAYRAALQSGAMPMTGPFPAPTTIMIFGLWWVPFFFVVLYVVSFDRWIATPEDLEKFEQLIAGTEEPEVSDE